MISSLAGYALLVAGAAYGVKFWLSDPEKITWPRACLALRLLWLAMTGGCAFTGIALIRGTVTVHPTGTLLVFVVAVVSLGEAAKMVKDGGIPFRRPPKTDHVHVGEGG